MSSDEKNKEERGSFSAIPRKFFLPKDLDNATPEKIWSWWQEKRLQEGLLKNAIVSGKVSILKSDIKIKEFMYEMHIVTKTYFTRRTYFYVLKIQKDIRSDFEEFRPYLAADKAEVLQTQGDFCRAVAEADSDLMRSIWHNSPEAMCFKVEYRSRKYFIEHYNSVVLYFCPAF